MQDKSIIIIGAGLGGLAAGIFGQLNGYKTEVFEMHNIPGGQCTAWKRRGYTFDACIHHLFGCTPATPLHTIWKETGAMPRELVPLRECVSVLSADGKLLRDYYDLERLESHLNEMAPADHTMIRDYISGIKAAMKSDAMGAIMAGSKTDLIKAIPGFVRSMRWLKPTMGQYGLRFRDPFLRRAVPLLVYANPEVPLLIHMARHAYGNSGALQWPVGGARDFAASIADRYVGLGGTIHYRSRVTGIVTRHSKACGIRLEDGSEHSADVVISNADGRKTILEMLEGRFIDDRVRSWCPAAQDEMPFAVQIFLGVNRDLSAEPSSMVIILDPPVELAGHLCHEFELQTYGFDPTMAPTGKGVIKVELTSTYSHWKALATDRESYVAAKQEVADRVIDLLERRYFTGLRQQVEVIDVSTLVTWERFTGGTMGLGIYPTKTMSIMGSIFAGSRGATLPGLSDFYFAGTWATSAGALFMNALSGKRVINAICRSDGKAFVGRLQ